MNITWTVNPLERRTSDGFVYTAHWQCVGVDGEHSAAIYATASWQGNPTSEYDSLTEEQVLGWVWELVDKEATEAAVAANLAAKINPVVAVGVPWSK